MKDYKKLYEDANKRVATRFGSDVARELFQDLYESENEKIRKEIIEFISQYSQGSFNLGIKDITFKKWLAWLEEQREKLPVGFYYVNSEGKKFYSDTLKYGDVTVHVEKQSEQKPANSAKTCKDEQKPSWSEEDEKIIETMCKEGDLRPSQMIWLKSLKNRVQPRQEWNENDKEQLDRAIYMMGQLGLTKSWDDVYNWLKSLKDRILI